MNGVFHCQNSLWQLHFWIQQVSCPTPWRLFSSENLLFSSLKLLTGIPSSVIYLCTPSFQWFILWSWNNIQNSFQEWSTRMGWWCEYFVAHRTMIPCSVGFLLHSCMHYFQASAEFLGLGFSDGWLDFRINLGDGPFELTSILAYVGSNEWFSLQVLM